MTGMSGGSGSHDNTAALRREIPRNLSNNHRADIRRRITEGERIAAEEIVQLLDGYDSLLDANMRLVLGSERMEGALDSITDQWLALKDAVAVADDVLRHGENDGGYNAHVIQTALNRLDEIAARFSLLRDTP